MSDPMYLKEVARKWNELAPYILDYNYTVTTTATADNKIGIADNILKEYLQDRPISKNTFNDLVQVK